MITAYLINLSKELVFHTWSHSLGFYKKCSGQVFEETLVFSVINVTRYVFTENITFIKNKGYVIKHCVFSNKLYKFLVNKQKSFVPGNLSKRKVCQSQDKREFANLNRINIV